jgi:hypothetical protein
MAATRRADGAYELRGGYGEHRFESTWLRVSREGYAPRAVTFYGQDQGYRFRVALSRGGAIAGHVWASGEPVRGGLILVEGDMGGSVVGFSVTGADGSFEIGALDAGDTLSVHAYDPRLDPIAVLSVTLGNGERRVLEIGGPGATTIEGRVAQIGKPLPSAQVRVSGADYSDSAATGRDGWYRIEGLRAGPHEVEVFADTGYVQRYVDLAEGQRLRLDIDASAVISGVVVYAETGAPVTEIRDMDVRARRDGSRGSDSARVDPEGRFRLHVEPGVYELDLPDEHAVYVIERPRVDVTGRTGSEPVTLRVVRDPQDGQIVLDVRDGTTGETVQEGDYEYECKITTGWGGFEEGRVEETGLSLGLHRFQVWSAVHASARLDVTLTPEHRVVRQVIELPRSAAVRVVETERGGPAAVAGLQIGDVIRKCNGVSTPSIAALTAALANAPGAVSIEFERGGERSVVTTPTNELGAEVENILLGG